MAANGTALRQKHLPLSKYAFWIASHHFLAYPPRILHSVVNTRFGLFSRCLLTCALLLSAVMFGASCLSEWEHQQRTSTVFPLGLAVFCLLGSVAVWRAGFARRMIAALIALAYLAYAIDECFLHFDGDWGWNERRGASTPINALLGLFFLGLPCLIYAVLGRLTLRKPAPGDDDGFEA